LTYKVEIGGVEYPFTRLSIERRIDPPDQFAVELPRIEPLSLGSTVDIYREGSKVFSGLLEEMNPIHEGESGYRLRLKGRCLTAKLFRKLIGAQSWVETKLKTVVQTLIADTGLTEGEIQDPFLVWHKWRQDADSEFQNNTLANTKISGTGTAAKIVFDDTIQNLDQYLDAGFDAENGLGSNDYRMAQSFTPTVMAPIARVSLYVRRYGDPTSIFVEIRTVADGKPTSTVLTSKTLTGSSVPTTTSWVDFEFDTKPVLASGTQYAIVIGGTGIDSWNGFAWSIDNDNGYPNGAWMYAQYGTDWSSPGTQDAGFKTFMMPETGEVVSPVIQPVNWQTWINFSAEGNDGGGSLKFDILDSLDNVLIANLTLADLPYDISSLTQSAIKLKAKFAWSVGGTVSPELDLWFVTHKSDYVNFTVDYESRFEALRRLADIVGAEWWVEPDGKFYFKQERGQDKSASVKLKVGETVLSLQHRVDMAKLANKIYVIGAGEGGQPHRNG
jgi:hypothetical protein